MRNRRAVVRFGVRAATDGTSAVVSGDNVIPIGAGATGVWGRLHVDTRLTWRRTFDDDLFRTPAGSSADASLSHWTLSARGGIEF